ncbi:uncharacterized protein OCT59_017840 [Rhizophagus irregularis]|uniref:F-box domain-containing protein n=4 Tax=Rhizophagus irregularis TaxID=588596 RepID=A0A015I7W3_RHIIW|nr:hypothetical protein RirG_246270 [Rhizophagus irregularis DAOM 197198w]UZO25575.1 hypothetical protein OCT59_017840 [Rhizophagus irregularis]
MAFILQVDCLCEVFEYLEDDRPTLYSCLLVNRLWCKISVRILWRNIWNFDIYQKDSLRVATSILSTLIACLPNESKELLHENNIFISTPTFNPPLFNYARFCKVLSIDVVDDIINEVLPENRISHLATNEIIKMFTNQISSLKKLTYYDHLNISFPHFPNARDLSELCCKSELPSSFFYQLSQICHNLQSISLDFYCNDDVSNELKELISLQNNLKILSLSAYDGNWADIIPIILKHSHTITELRLYNCDSGYLPFSFVSSFSNLQKLIMHFIGETDFKDFKKSQYTNFFKLEILIFPFNCPKTEYILKFLENNGKNLKTLYIGENDEDLSLSISKFCPNIKNLFIRFHNDEINSLKNLFINCQYLESIKIKIQYGKNRYFSGKEILETVVNHSPNNFCELKLCNGSILDVCPKDLESLFKSWENRIPKKLLKLTIVKMLRNNKKFLYKEGMEIIEKYEKLGIIKFRSIYEENF